MPRIGREIPEMLEVSIGHALLADALYLGSETGAKLKLLQLPYAFEVSE